MKKLIRKAKFWGVLIGASLGAYIWKVIIIDQHAKDNIAELWVFFGVAFFIFVAFYLRKEISALIDKWE